MQSRDVRGASRRLLAVVAATATALALATATPAAAQRHEAAPGQDDASTQPQGSAAGSNDTPDAATAEMLAAEDHVTPARVDGRTRFETAANIATLTFESAETAVIVTGQDYPDALAGSFAAGMEDGPLLLVTRDGVPGVTWQTLDDLGVEHIKLVGGTAAISAAVEDELRHNGYNTQRLSGVNRFETAASVARFYGLAHVGTFEGDRTAILASGEAFPDALSAGPLAARANLPLLLTPTAAPTGTTPAVFDELDIERILVIGGSGAVSADVVRFYTDRGLEVERFSGRNRMETATVVAQNAIERVPGFSPAGVLLARGDDYPDALTASIHGGVIGAPLLLTATPTVLSPATEGWLADTCPAIDFVRALGGVGAVSDQVLGEAVDAADRCHDDPDPTQDYILSPQEVIEADPGDEQQFFLIGEGDDVAHAGELALFPCDNAVFEGGAVIFTDADGDGFADGAGTTDTGNAWISRINGIEQTRDQVRDRGFDPDGYHFHLRSDAPDCAVPVIWDVRAGQELPVDDRGAPTVRYGAGVIVWTAGG